MGQQETIQRDEESSDSIFHGVAFNQSLAVICRFIQFYPAGPRQADLTFHMSKRNFPDKGANNPAVFSAPFALVFRIEEQRVMTSEHDKSS
jgi:hypothetical protein